MKTVTRNKMLTIAHIAELAGLRSRSIRFVIDHKLVEGVRVMQSSHGGVRRLLPFDAAVVAMAASLLHLGVSADGVKAAMRGYAGAARTKKHGSLYLAWSRMIQGGGPIVACKFDISATYFSWLDAEVDFYSLAQAIHTQGEL
jgi:hypothetical protein